MRCSCWMWTEWLSPGTRARSAFTATPARKPWAIRHLSCIPVKTTLRPGWTKNSGEFDRIPEANDAFLELVGYSREDLQAGRLHWPELTPPEYLPLDELAHEEGLRFGACTPFEKELIRKDGTRVPVLIATAVLKLSPFRWITFVQDLRGLDRLENVNEEVVEVQQNFEEIVGSSTAMKRATSLWICSQNCCARCRRSLSRDWAARAPYPSTYGWWRRPTGT